MVVHIEKGMIIAYLIWKGSYNRSCNRGRKVYIIAYLIWKGSYNSFELCP